MMHIAALPLPVFTRWHQLFTLVRHTIYQHVQAATGRSGGVKQRVSQVLLQLDSAVCIDQDEYYLTILHTRAQYIAA
jgi:hypothetical protein